MSAPESRSLVGLLVRDHELIRKLCRAAMEAEDEDRWQQLVASDTFLVMGSRHLGAVEDVLYPAMRRHLSHGTQRARAHAREARAFERTMRRLFASMYGEVHHLDVPRDDLWTDAEARMVSHMRDEEELAAAVEQTLPQPQREALANAHVNHFERAPTRPHPYIPHASPFGRIARKLLSISDRMQDVMDNRLVQRKPQPLHPKRGNRVSQYLTGRPEFEADDQPRREEPR